MPRNEIARFYGKSVFSDFCVCVFFFLRNCHTIFQSIRDIFNYI